MTGKSVREKSSLTETLCFLYLAIKIATITDPKRQFVKNEKQLISIWAMSIRFKKQQQLPD